MTLVPSYLLDANVILRFLLNDHPEHSKAAKSLVKRARKQELSLVIPMSALTEAIFTLKSFYKHPREEISHQIFKIFTSPGISFLGPNWILEAIDEFGEKNVSFGDACLAAEARASGLAIASFDSDFDTFTGIQRFEPR